MPKSNTDTTQSLATWYDNNTTSTTIKRPVALVVPFKNGYSFELSHAEWNVVYCFQKWTPNESDAKAKANDFLVYFDQEAKKIESGEVRPYPIMRRFIDAGYFRYREKLSDAARKAVGM